MHPEDEIYKIKNFTNELRIVQESYFNNLVSSLKLTKEGEDFLFDYIYNHDFEEFDDFVDYLNSYNKKYEDFVIKNDPQSDTIQCFAPYDSVNFTHISSIESYTPDLDTDFEHYEKTK